MRATVASFSAEHGHGVLLLEDGSSLAFDVHACKQGVPLVGAKVMVELGPGYKGRTRVVRVTFEDAPEWSGILREVGKHPVALCVNPDGPKIVSVALAGAAWNSSEPQREGMRVLCSVPSVQLRRGYAIRAVAARPATLSPEATLVIDRYLAAEQTLEEKVQLERRAGPIHPLEPIPTEFRYVADGGVAAKRHAPFGQCALCKERPGREYVLTAEQDSSLPVGADVLICDVCVLAGKVKFFSARDFVAYAKRAYPMRAIWEHELIARAIAEKLNRTPQVVIWMQDPDWPVCCEEPTDYVGNPANFASFENFAETASHYELGACSAKGDLKELTEYDPETWEDVNCFICSPCDQRYFTFQHT